MDEKAAAEAVLDQMYAMARAQFGDAIQTHWFYPGPCPGCGRPIDAMVIDGEQALSVNAYIYRKRGALIGYFLCGRCAARIHESAKRRPGRPTPLHATIEANLRAAYDRYRAATDA